MSLKEVDFVIVGAGSAGCVLADKLSASGGYHVVLIEAGPSDNRFWIRTPIGYGVTYTAVSYTHLTLPTILRV